MYIYVSIFIYLFIARYDWHYPIIFVQLIRNWVYIWNIFITQTHIFKCVEIQQRFLSFLQLEKLISKDNLHYEVICFHYYIQYHLHIQVSSTLSLLCITCGVEQRNIIAELCANVVNCQLSEAANYAREQGVILKGDLPIGVDRNSVDTWVYPNLFRMNTSTGAPPDYFDKNGQNWGFPTYNWEEMSKDNYAWWRARLSQVFRFNLCCIFALRPSY